MESSPSQTTKFKKNSNNPLKQHQKVESQAKVIIDATDCKIRKVASELKKSQSKNRRKDDTQME